MIFVITFILCIYILLGRYSGINRVKGVRYVSGGYDDEPLEAGVTLGVKIDVQVPGIWPIPYVIVKDTLVHRSKGKTSFESTLIPDWKRTGSVEYRTHPLRRGLYRFERTDCSTGDIFGVFDHRGQMDLGHHFSVYPRTIGITEWKQMNQMLKGMHHHSSTTRAHRETTQINGVREYNYGDRLSRIHWNATARTGTWKSKEFERESMPKTIIVLDRSQRSYGSEEVFETGVSVAASLFQYGKKRGVSMGLLSVGKDSVMIEPKVGAVSFVQVMNHLIDVQADGYHPLLSILEDRSRNLSPGTFVVLITPQKGEGVWKALNWVHQKQMNGCHIRLGWDPAEDPAPWVKFVNSKGFLAYPVSSLEDLPAVLGGRGY
ncbi:DUF58 domain-containing protein [Gorillibacterium massiliense]|uniref:DUF58 domain-containing protein n=1 Tax=Gorillibacterium massiliense TaxID=1280390 RepID=UPI001EE25FD8|nr:DUF58 domain-containing protein [Gorillibacterium massiliense]